MCGIAGIFSRKKDLSIDHAVDLMVSALSHRGPDDQGTWSDSQAGIYFGHRRLSIVDLTQEGHQPMRSHCGRYVAVFNGEIYNHSILRDKLGKQVHNLSWNGHSDTETMLSCFSLWGVEKTLNKMVGMFSIAIWDNDVKKLYLARDRFGEKPLYYGWLGNEFVFSSELKSIQQSLRFKPVVDRNVLAVYMRHTYVPAPYSIYQNIFKLEPGCLLSISEDAINEAPEFMPTAPVATSGLALSRWWSLEDTIAKSTTCLITDEIEAAEKLEDVLIDSIRMQSIADVPVGAFLSGGIDSSCIVALMQQQSLSSPVKTFTIGFNEGAYNEAIYAKDVAQHLGTDHTEIYVSSSDALGVIPLIPEVYDEPFADSSQIPTYLVSKLASTDVRVVLSGDAGDELFGGYNRYFWVQRIWNKISWLPKPLRILFSHAITTISPIHWDHILRLLDLFLSNRHKSELFGDKLHKLAVRLKTVDDLNDLYLSLVSEWGSPSDVVIGAHESPTILNKIMNTTSLGEIEHRMMYWDSMSYLTDDILCKVDRASMANSLETRIPFLDHRVAELAWSLPLEMKIKGGEGKRILRQVLYKYVPKELIERPKAGFSVPVSEWLRGPLRRWAEELLDVSRLREEGYFHPEPIRKKWEEHISGTRNWSQSLWTVLMFQAWLEKN
jgi:asparagine synthase (glutamine-hydrolysing)